MSNPWVVLLVSVVLIAASAFFVAVEFALIAARTHRLAEEAATSRSARAAVRSATDLSVLLAGAQLGITVCTLALGAITKPAVHYALTPLIAGWGAPAWVADVAGFVLALIVVTFLHLVVGEMAPKSWAIAHPERSAILLALPMRAFLIVTRPVLLSLNSIANWFLRRVGVEPVDETSTGQDPAALRHLVEHSGATGALDAEYRDRLLGALDLEQLTVADVLGDRDTGPAQVDVDATPAEIRAVAARSGHLRLLVRSGSAPVGMVHARDAVVAADTTARDLMRPVVRVAPQEHLGDLLHTMRTDRTHLAVVIDDDRTLGVVTVTDVADRILRGTTDVPV
ncbi:hemolysin family protein [Williamsia sp. SKLECPSW1]